MQNAYFYDTPFENDNQISERFRNQGFTDFRDLNIYIASRNYQWARGIDSSFGATLQSSGQHDNLAKLKDPTSTQLIYSGNLALMHGARYFDFYTYYPNTPDGTAGTTTGMLYGITQNWDPTPKWYMWRDTLKPRLQGLFGKTIKTINPTQQLLNIIAGQFSGAKYISNILASRADIPGENEFIAVYNDLGFFEKGDKEYFMLLNRHYNVHSKFKYKVTINHPDGYNNYRITDYVDTTEWFIQNGSYFIDTISRGDARLYSVLPVVKYGGKIKYSETVTNETLKAPLNIATGATLYVNGTYNIYGDVTIDYGGKLVVLPGSVLNFYNNTSLINNGELIANGTVQDSITFDFVWKNADPLNGIKLTKNSYNTEMSYCKIRHAYHGIEIDSVTPTIEHCRIFENYDGLYLLNSDYEITCYFGTKIWHNTIHNNTDAGIRLIDSSPWIAGNTISGNWAGVRCLTSSNAYFGELGDPGLNDIVENNYGVYSWGSSVTLGFETDPIVAGFNEINNIDYDLIADHGSIIEAQYNCFPEFDENKILELDSSVIIVEPMDPNCEQRGNKSIVNNDPSKNVLNKQPIPTETDFTLLNKARKLFLSGNKYLARSICKTIISSNPTAKITPLALDMLIATYKNANAKDSLKTYLSAITGNNSQGYFSGYAKVKLADLDKENYIVKLDNIISTYSNTGILELALFKKFLHYFFEQKDRNAAVQISEQMSSSCPNSELTKETKSLLGINTLSKKTEDVVLIPEKYFIGNYPNPFNPTTTIKYSLPKAEKVSIMVYDVLGRKVKELVNEDKEAGTYELKFNTSNLSSGVYFYRIITKDFVKTMKMILMK